MNEEILYADATVLAERIRIRDLSPVDVVKAHLERIDAINPKLNAIVTLVDGAMEQATSAETAIMRGESRGPLHGVPFTIKDCIDTEGVRTTRGSKLFEDHIPSQDAVVVKRLKEAGGILIGKTNMPEFALWWETGNLVFGFTENPWKRGRTTGGSSGGEASAIAAGLSPLGMGSDVGGSIRLPSHYCGIVGLKPTHGRVPLTGHWPETLLRFMHVGPMARSVRDIALALTIVSGPDGIDHYAVPMPTPQFGDLRSPLPQLRIGWCAEGPFAPVAREVQTTISKAVSSLEEMGCVVEQVSLDSWEQWPSQAISMSFFVGEGSLYLEPFITGREDQLAPSMQRRLSLPKPTFREYLEAVQNVELLRMDLGRFFTKYDLLLCPTSPLAAHPHDTPELTIDGQTVQGRNSLRATVPFDLTGSPAVSVPFGWNTEGLPIGVQLVARHFREPTLLHAAAALEAVHESDRRRPPV